MTVWLCIVALYSSYDGSVHASYLVDNLATLEDCQRVAATVKSTFDAGTTAYHWPPRAVCVEVRKARR